MLRVARTLVLIVALAAAGFFFREPLRVFAYQAYGMFAPCDTPIPYEIGAVDERFGLSDAALRNALDRAELLWEDAAGRELFRRVEAGGVLTVSLVYDERQETTERLQALGIHIEANLDSYNEMRSRYEAALAAFEAHKAAYERDAAAFERAVAAYEAEVAQWNARGGAPRTTYASLERQREELAAEEARLDAARESINREASEVNALVSAVNRLASQVNAGARSLNSAGHDEEFEEASFESTPGWQQITVYEFDSSAKLTRVLAHEFGHALGMEHVGESGAIMFRLNEGEAIALRAADVAELQRACRISS